MFAWFVGFVVLGLSLCERRCFPGDPCFPGREIFAEFQSGLDGSLFYPNDTGYDSIILMYNLWRVKKPFAVIVAASTSDVQKSVIFARTYNLHFHVKTSGHDFNGRSTAARSLEINLSNMTKSSVSLNSSRAEAGEIMVESGKRWVAVYEEVDKYDRVIVGGSAHAVSMGGYTLGGGHSPICRMLGMAVDNLLEVEMVSANGSIIKATAYYTVIISTDGSVQNTTETDIFWALSGGGTFGIVTRFYFRLHNSPEQVVRMSLIYPILLQDGTNIGKLVMTRWAEILPNLPRQWGGYFIVAWNYDATFQTTGYLHFFLNHFGPNGTDSFDYIKQIADYIPFLRAVEYKVYKTFWEYEKTVYDPPYMNGYVFNSLLHNGSFTEPLADFILSTVLNRTNPNIGASFTGTLTGGKMMEVSADATSVHPGFRRSLMALTGGIGWDPSYNDHIPNAIKYGASLSEKIQSFGDGMYPNEAGADVKNWQENFWGSNYGRLLEIKQKWDPEYFFICKECVGSEYYNEKTTVKVPTTKLFTTSSTTNVTHNMTGNERSSTLSTGNESPWSSRQTETTKEALSTTESTASKVNDTSAASQKELLKVQVLILSFVATLPLNV